MFGTSQETEEENLIILWDDTDTSAVATLTPEVKVESTNISTEPQSNTSEFVLDLGENITPVQSEVITSNENTAETIPTFSLEGLDLSSPVVEQPTSLEAPEKTQSESFNFDLSTPTTPVEVESDKKEEALVDSFSLAPESSLEKEESSDMVSILTDTINKLKARQSVIDETKTKKTEQIEGLNNEISKLKESVSDLKDEVSVLDAENMQIQKNVESLEAMKWIPSVNAKVHTIKRAPNTKKV